MTANLQEFDMVPDERWELMLHLEAIAKKRAELGEIAAEHERLRALMKPEAEAQARVHAIRERAARELAENLKSSDGPRATVDHAEQAEAERELAHAAREADAARACEPAVRERMAAAGAQIAALEWHTLNKAADVMLFDAGELAAEIDADARRLRAKYARLWGLRRYLADTPKILKRLEDVPEPFHPDNVAPDLGELMVAAEAWRYYAERLRVDADAEFGG